MPAHGVAGHRVARRLRDAVLQRQVDVEHRGEVDDGERHQQEQRRDNRCLEQIRSLGVPQQPPRSLRKTKRFMVVSAPYGWQQQCHATSAAVQRLTRSRHAGLTELSDAPSCAGLRHDGHCEGTRRIETRTTLSPRGRPGRRRSRTSPAHPPPDLLLVGPIRRRRAPASAPRRRRAAAARGPPRRASDAFQNVGFASTKPTWVIEIAHVDRMTHQAIQAARHDAAVRRHQTEAAAERHLAADHDHQADGRQQHGHGLRAPAPRPSPGARAAARSSRSWSAGARAGCDRPSTATAGTA